MPLFPLCNLSIKESTLLNFLKPSFSIRMKDFKRNNANKSNVCKESWKIISQIRKMLRIFFLYV